MAKFLHVIGLIIIIMAFFSLIVRFCGVQNVFADGICAFGEYFALMGFFPLYQRIKKMVKRDM